MIFFFIGAALLAAGIIWKIAALLIIGALLVVVGLGIAVGN